jgi:PTS system mannose-specific IIA component
MIGIVIVTHCNLGHALIEASEFILGAPSQGVIAVSVDINESADKLRKKILAGIKEVNHDDGVMLLTDMFGGTPSNLSYSLLEEGSIEVLSGINLPVLIKAIHLREQMNLQKLSENLVIYGKESISLASQILKGNKRN